jgi:beta-glucanase (GH16 family)
MKWWWIGVLAGWGLACSGSEAEPPEPVDEPVDEPEELDTDVEPDPPTLSDTSVVQPLGDCQGLDPAYTFCEAFEGDVLNTERWWYGRKHWGPAPPDNHGVAPENVRVADGSLWLTANGDHYSGDVQGVRKHQGYVQDQPGTRTGAMIVSDAYFGSGRFEVRMRLPEQVGPCSAVWTFHYQEIYEGQDGYDEHVAAGYHIHGNANLGYWVVPNHEIDIELPTALPGESTELARYDLARYNTWIGERPSEFTEAIVEHAASLADGEFHVWAIEWHTGGDGISPEVAFFVDGELLHTSSTHIPDIASRLNLGIWFPQWAGGEADFDVQVLEVDWVRFQPFRESHDRFVDESYPNDGMTKCADKASNDAGLPECRISTF